MGYGINNALFPTLPCLVKRMRQNKKEPLVPECILRTACLLLMCHASLLRVLSLQAEDLCRSKPDGFSFYKRATQAM